MALLLIDMPQSLRICIVCALSMPLGLNSIVIPRAFDLDTTDAAGMILISHLFSCATIPLVFAIFNLI
jgi:predicted permease